MQKEIKKDSTEFKFMTDYFKFIQKFYTPEDKDEYWSSLLEEGNKLHDKYKGCKLAEEHILFFLNWKEREGVKKG